MRKYTRRAESDGRYAKMLPPMLIIRALRYTRAGKPAYSREISAELASSAAFCRTSAMRIGKAAIRARLIQPNYTMPRPSFYFFSTRKLAAEHGCHGAHFAAAFSNFHYHFSPLPFHAKSSESAATCYLLTSSEMCRRSCLSADMLIAGKKATFDIFFAALEGAACTAHSFSP